MIGRLLATYRAAAAAPVHPVTAVLGVVCVVVGTGVLQRFVQQQQQELGRAYAQYRSGLAAGAQLREPYPAAEDLNPLRAGACDPDRCEQCGEDHMIDAEHLANADAR